MSDFQVARQVVAAPARPTIYRLEAQCSRKLCGPSPPLSLFDSLEAPTQSADVLFLGADPWHLLASLADRPSQALLLVKAVMVYRGPWEAARCLLLFQLASTLRPDRADDMLFLWEVWYCATLSPKAAKRLSSEIEQMADERFGWMTPLLDHDEEEFEELLHWWVFDTEGAMQQANTCYKTRDQARKGPIARQRAGYTGPLEDFDLAAYDQQAAETLSYEVFDPQEVLALGSERIEALRRAVRDDLVTWNSTGTLTPTGPLTATSKTLQANFTFLGSHDETWPMDWDSSPVRHWMPFRVRALYQYLEDGPGLVCRACVDAITDLVRRFQQNATLYTERPRRAPVGNRTQLTVCWQLAYVSVLGVCLQYHLQADEEAPYVSQGKVMPGKPYSGKAPKGKAAIETTLFDVIVADASVCDEEGMLPVLVSTSPRLKQSQQARIYALTYAWGFIADNIRTYLDMSLSMPLELVPTLLGLRLLTDVDQGAPAYLSTSGVEFNEHTRGWLLEWGAMDAFTSQQMPTHKPRLLIPNTKKPTASTGNPKKNKSKGAKAPEPPPDPTHDGLFSALMTLTRHCCRVDYTKQTDKELRAPMRACTPYTLAFLLASAISRMDVRIHGDTPARSEKEALIALRDACMLIIPPPLMLSFKSITEMLLLSLDEAEAEAAGVESAAMKALRKAAQKTHVSSRSELAAAMSLLGHLPLSRAWDEMEAAGVKPEVRLAMMPCAPEVLTRAAATTEKEKKRMRADVERLLAIKDWLMDGQAPPVPDCHILDAVHPALDLPPDGPAPPHGWTPSVTVTFNMANSAMRSLASDPSSMALLLFDLKTGTLLSDPVSLLTFAPGSAIPRASLALCSMPSLRDRLLDRNPRPIVSGHGTAAAELLQLTEGTKAYKVLCKISKESSMVAVQTPHANTYLDNLLQVMPLDDRKQPLPPLEVNLPWPVVAFVATDNPKAREAYTSPSGGVVMSVVQVPSDYPVKQFIVKKAVTWTQWPKHNPSYTLARRKIHIEQLSKAIIGVPTQLTYGVFSSIEGRDDMNSVRSVVQRYFLYLLCNSQWAKSNLIYGLVSQDHPLRSKERAVMPSVMLLLQPPALRGPNGVPLMPAVVFDLRLSKTLSAYASANDQLYERMEKGAGGQIPKAKLSEDEINGVMRQLYVNAQRCVANGWQSEYAVGTINDPSANILFLSYVSPCLVEHPSGLCPPDHAAKWLSTKLPVKGVDIRAKRNATSGTSAGVPGVVTEAPPRAQAHPAHVLWSIASTDGAKGTYAPRDDERFVPEGGYEWAEPTDELFDQIDAILERPIVADNRGAPKAGADSSTAGEGSSSRQSTDRSATSPAKPAPAAPQGSGQTTESAKKGSGFNLSFDKKPRAAGAAGSAAGPSNVQQDATEPAPSAAASAPSKSPRMPSLTTAVPLYATPASLPWRTSIPRYIKGSFTGFGRHILEYAAAAASVPNIQRRLDAYDDPPSLTSAEPAVRVWADCARAFAHSPFAAVLEPVAAWDCIRLAVNKLKGNTPVIILPSHVEEHMQYVCAQGCGKVAGEGETKKMTDTAWNGALYYCSKDCHSLHAANRSTYEREHGSDVVRWLGGMADTTYLKDYEKITRKPDASPSLPPRSRTPSSTSQLQYTDTTKLPWLRILPPEAHGTPHGYGSYIYNAAVGPYKSPNNTKHLQPIYEEPTKRSALTTDNEDWWFRSLALCARAFAYSPFASVVPIEAARDCVVAAAKLVPMANLKRGGVVPSLVEQRLDQVCARGCGVVKPIEQQLQISVWNGNVRFCSKQCMSEHVESLLEDKEALGDQVYQWQRGMMDELYKTDYNMNPTPGRAPLAGGTTGLLDLKRVNDDEVPWRMFLPPGANHSVLGMARYLFALAVNSGHGRPVPDARRLFNTPSEHTQPQRVLANCALAFAYTPHSCVLPPRTSTLCLQRAAAEARRTGRSIVLPSFVTAQMDTMCAWCTKPLKESKPASRGTCEKCDMLTYCSEGCQLTHAACGHSVICLKMLRGTPRVIMDNHFETDHGDVPPPNPAAATATPEPQPARLALQPAQPLAGLYAAELPLAYMDLCPAAKACGTKEGNGPGTLAISHLTQDLYQSVASTLGMPRDAVTKVLRLAEERGGPSGLLVHEACADAQGLQEPLWLWTAVHVLVRAVGFYAVERAAVEQALVQYMKKPAAQALASTLLSGLKQVCAQCGKPLKEPAFCGGCEQSVAYCGEECQRKHWKGAHRGVCKQLASHKVYNKILIEQADSWGVGAGGAEGSSAPPAPPPAAVAPPAAATAAASATAASSQAAGKGKASPFGFSFGGGKSAAQSPSPAGKGAAAAAAEPMARQSSSGSAQAKPKGSPFDFSFGKPHKDSSAASSTGSSGAAAGAAAAAAPAAKQPGSQPAQAQAGKAPTAKQAQAAGGSGSQGKPQTGQADTQAQQSNGHATAAGSTSSGAGSKSVPRKVDSKAIQQECAAYLSSNPTAQQIAAALMPGQGQGTSSAPTDPHTLAMQEMLLATGLLEEEDLKEVLAVIKG